jgi:glycosyltransferase involved in cell wall biosynthesis
MFNEPPEMKFIFTSYISSPEYDRPHAWLKRIQGYTGILGQLAKSHTVVGIERINYEGEYMQDGVHYYFIRQRRKIARFPFYQHRLIKKIKPDIVFINGFIFPLQVVQLRLTLGPSVKIILLHRAERPAKGIKKLLQRLSDKCVNAYLFTATEFGNEWQSNIDTRKIHEVIQASSVFHPASRNVAREATLVEGDPVFLWVGSLTQRKDPLTVVNAFLEFVKTYPGARLYMIYQSAELLREINALVEKSAQRNAVILIGRVDHDQLLAWYNSADFFITGSHYEGSGVALSEAMSCGCIPITSDFISFKKMTNQCGLMYPAGNEKELIKILLQTPGLDREKVKIEVLRQFHDELSFEAIARKIQNVIDSL